MKLYQTQLYKVLTKEIDNEQVFTCDQVQRFGFIENKVNPLLKLFGYKVYRVASFKSAVMTDLFVVVTRKDLQRYNSYTYTTITPNTKWSIIKC